LFCVEKIGRALNDHGKPFRGSRIAIMGVSYKAGVGDMRESPAVKIIRLLIERGADLTYYDPYVPELPEFGLKASSFEDAIADADAGVIVTRHPELDVERLVAETPLVVDFRGATRAHEPNVVRL
jgi:UDP-N-acetyl-D-glucosamine dehydrogenase